MATGRLERLILVGGFSAAVVSGVLVYQMGGPYGELFEHDPRAQIDFDAANQLTVVAFDSDGNLTLDTKGFLDGERLVRLEVDDDDDGSVDERRYYESNDQLKRIEHLDGQGQVVQTDDYLGGKLVAK